MLRILFLLFLFLTLSASAGVPDDKGHFISLCRIFDVSGKLLHGFPGRGCLFSDDGSFISLGNDGLRGYSSEGAIKWKFPIGRSYNYINFTADKMHVLLVASSDHEGSQEVRLYKLDLEGKVIHEGTLKGVPVDNARNLQIVEIPNSVGKKGKVRSGDFILSGHPDGLLIFSSDLKKMVHAFRVQTSAGQQLSSISFTSSGNAIFINHIAKESTESVPVSSIDEYDLRRGKLLKRYPKIPHGLFYLPAGGSIDLMDEERVLFGHPKVGLYILSWRELKIIFFSDELHYDLFGLNATDSVQHRNLKLFLSNWKF